MIIVHDTFICKPGNASKMAKLFKEAMEGSPEMLHIMTDMTGQWHRVIMVSQYENLTAYEKKLGQVHGGYGREQEDGGEDEGGE